MPRCTTRGEHHTVDLEKLFVRHVDATEPGGPLLLEEPTTHRVRNGFRLLEDLFDHEVGMAATFYRFEVPVHH